MTSALTHRASLHCLLGLALGLPTALAEPSPREAYTWRNVAIGGGGYVTGIVTHPQEPDLVYIRTDVGGAFRWDPVHKRWIQLLGALTFAEWNLNGIDAIALDPSDPNVVYLSAGKYARASILAKQAGRHHWATWSPGDPEPSDILKSVDRGRTWQRTGLHVDAGGNTSNRWAGERLAVDPRSPAIVYFGSRNDGLWRTARAAEPGSWERVATFPSAGRPGEGIIFVAFDPRGAPPGQPSRTIYAGICGEGVARSIDGGETWSLLPGSPSEPARCALAPDGTLFVTHARGLARFSAGAWQDVTPEPGSYSGVSVDPRDPTFVFVSQRGRGFRSRAYRSTDGGATFSELSYSKRANVPWWPDHYWAAATSCVALDPHRPGRAWLTDWYGTWVTNDIRAGTTEWVTHENGHEQVCVLALLSPPVGAPLLSGIMDISGFRHDDLDRYPAARHPLPSAKEVSGLDFCEAAPHVIVQVGGSRQRPVLSHGAYSEDGGTTWRPFGTVPDGASDGRVALSATDPRHVVWLPARMAPLVSRDGGLTWIESRGAPSGSIEGNVIWNQPLASDRADGSRFYLYHAGRIHRSGDGGLTWEPAASVPDVQKHTLEAAPGRPGEVWLATDRAGLFRSQDAGATFTRVPGVDRAYLFSFGRNRPGYRDPAIFVYGTVAGAHGIFRSDDLGRSWVQIDVAEPAVGNDPTVMEGDRQVHGRVYISTFGNSIFYGAPDPRP